MLTNNKREVRIVPCPRARSRRFGAFALPGFGLLIAAALLLQTSFASAQGTVTVLYAGSLVNLMEHGVGPAFDKASGDTFQGYAGGSGLLANQIKGKLRRADVFVSAAPGVNKALMGQSNGDWVSWYVTFAQSPLVIGYNASSKFAADFKTKPWYEVLGEPGIRIGRTDPKLDPKGKLTLTLMQDASAYYKDPGLSQRVLGAPENPAQVLPEEILVGRLQSGQLDVGFFYSTETADAKIPTRTLPPTMTPKAVYTVTIVRDGANPAAADKFVAFLLGPEGRKLMQQHGMGLSKPTISGDTSAVPADVRSLAAK
ncbi:MAG TPA: extracellular solute-binding protein [Acetobacteraceae bacterium]|jgi:molybdate/tungstate transport system substrate-binding protein